MVMLLLEKLLIVCLMTIDIVTLHCKMIHLMMLGRNKRVSRLLYKLLGVLIVKILLSYLNLGESICVVRWHI